LSSAVVSSPSFELLLSKATLAAHPGPAHSGFSFTVLEETDANFSSGMVLESSWFRILLLKRQSSTILLLLLLPLLRPLMPVLVLPELLFSLAARFKAFADALAAATRADLASRPAALLPGSGGPDTNDDDADDLPLAAAMAARAARVVSRAAAAAVSTVAVADVIVVGVVATARVEAGDDEELTAADHPAPGCAIAEVVRATSSGEGAGKAARAVLTLSSRRCKRSAFKAKRRLAMSVRTDK